MNILSAAVLHDTVEDTKTTKEELIENFGEKIAELVMKVTDDKSLPKVERKKFQIKHALEIGPEAGTVKLADKLHNLSSMLNDAPPTWSVGIIQGYFVWAKHVIDGLKGTNAGLEKALDKVFASEFEKDGKKYPCLPNKPLDIALNEYFELLKTENNKD